MKPLAYSTQIGSLWTSDMQWTVIGNSITLYISPFKVNTERMSTVRSFKQALNVTDNIESCAIDILGTTCKYKYTQTM